TLLLPEDWITCRWLGAPAAVAVGFLLQLLAAGVFRRGRRLAELQRQLATALPDLPGGQFVCLSPGSSVRFFGGQAYWDEGVLYLTADRLLYVGERLRFCLRRDQLSSALVGPGQSYWWPRPRLYLRWRSADGQGELALWPRPSADWLQAA